MYTISFFTLCLISVQKVIQNWRFTHIDDTVAYIIPTIYKTYIRHDATFSNEWTRLSACIDGI